MSCPIAMGRYYANDSSIDISTFSVLPIHGYTWMATFKFSSGEGKNRKLAMCVLMEVKITKLKEGKKN